MQLFSREPLPRPVPDTSLPRTVAELHGSRIAYVDAGDGDPVVLLHGIGSSAATWNGVMPLLAERYRVIAPDFPGHGRSSYARNDHSIAGFALFARDLLMGLGITRATFIGHSLGGGVTMQIAYAYPEMVDRMMLVDSGGLGREVGLALRAATLPGADLVIPLICNRPIIKVTHWLAHRIKPLAHPGLQELAYVYATLAHPAARRAFLAIVRGAMDFGGQRIDATPKLHLAEEVPTYVVWGEADVIIPISHAQRMLDLEVVDRFEVFERAGHFPHAEEPRRFSDLVDEFMQMAPARVSHADLAARFRQELGTVSARAAG
jgi:pimeloyl-ACP methyl ester carboxylesterase